MRRFLIAAVVIATVAAAAYFYLGRVAEDVVRTRVLPQAGRRLGVSVSIKGMSLNFLAGKAVLRGVVLGNPAGFGDEPFVVAPECEIETGFFNLADGNFNYADAVKIKDASVNIVKNESGRSNLETVLAVLAEGGRHTLGGAAGQRRQGGAAAFSEEAEFPFKMEFSGEFSYRDNSELSRPFSLKLKIIEFTARNIMLRGPADDLRGRVSVQGEFPAEDGRPAGRFTAAGRVGPLEHRERMSFDLSVSFESVPLELFQPHARRLGLEKALVAGEANLLCDRGVFPGGMSELHLVFTEIEPVPEFRARLGSFGVPDRLVVPVPVEGTISDPRADIEQAFLAALKKPENIEALIRSALRQDGKARE